MDNDTPSNRTPNLSPPAPLDGTYRYEVIQNVGVAGDSTYYIDLWFIYGYNPDLEGITDTLELKAGDKVYRDEETGNCSILKASKPRLRLVVNNE